MKKFFIGLLKAIGYFGIYFGMQLTVSFVYTIVKVLPVVMKYVVGGYDLMNPDIFQQYMNEAVQPILEATMMLTAISGILTLGILWLVFVCRKKRFAKEIGLRKLSFGTVPSILLMGLGFNVLTGVVLSVLPERWLGSYAETSSMVFMGDFWITAVGTAIVAPVVEEVIFRGLAYTRLKKGMPTVVAMIVTSALFGVAHGHPVWTLYTFVFGMVLIWVLERTQSLVASILLHFAYNSCAVLQMLLPENVPDWVGIVMLVVAIVMAGAGVFWFLKIPKVPVEEIPSVQEPVETEETELPGRKDDGRKTEEEGTVEETAGTVEEVVSEAVETDKENM